MSLLDGVASPADLRKLDPGELTQLAAEIRELLVDSVCRTGGHLGPNLGVVELTIALHRVFHSPEVPFIFDTGHQAYVHKILTGRRTRFHTLRASGGISGYPSRLESDHDLVENSHASTGLSYADGLSKAFVVAGAEQRQVVVVVGDGALTGGLAWEALNNLGRSRHRVVVVLNDNGRSYSPTVGAVARHLSRLADRPGYAALQDSLGGDRRQTGPTACVAGGLFEALGFTYLGPVDGHDITALESELHTAAALPGPVVVHCLTEKGRGYPPAERDPADRFHTVGVLDAATGRSAGASAATWTDAFADALVGIGAARPDVVAVSAAMLGPTGLQRFADRYPQRCYDVGIAEPHALTSAAGLATAGLHPVVALYATFANRAFDQTLLDVGLHRLPVTLVLDRAGVTGPDGPSHHGMWDLVLLGMVPGIRVAAPRDATTLVEQLDEAVEVPGPTALRFPKATLGPPVPAVRRTLAGDVLREGEAADVLVVCVGAMAGPAVEAAGLLEMEGIGCTVLDPGWVLPVPDSLSGLAGAHRAVVTVEDGLRVGGVGSHVADRLRADAVDTPVWRLGLPTAYLGQGTRAELLAAQGLDAEGVAQSVRAVYRSLPKHPRSAALLVAQRAGGHSG
jgi:1-deoxy-D-xylulose-5-phosphate synthase